jgi:glucose-6-phosphate isomerase
MSLKLDTTYLGSLQESEEYIQNVKKATHALKSLQAGSGKGSEFLGWLNLPAEIDPPFLDEISKTIQEIKDHSKVLIVIGIGGSYLGSNAVISALTSKFRNQIADSNNKLEIYFAGTNISSVDLNDLIDALGDKDFSINIISKSGTTTEPALAFRVLKAKLYEKYGEKASQKRIIATTDASKGALKKQADIYNWKTYIIPDNVGGRFSVFTPVGLLPIKAANINIHELIAGAKKAQNDLTKISNSNLAVQYAAIRKTLYDQGKSIEILANYEPRLSLIAAWWKQLFGESEGKENRGLFPASVDFTCDLHSMGQYIQEGPRHLFETILHVEQIETNITIPEENGNHDNLNYLAGKSLDYVNKKAEEGTLQAHVNGGVPNIRILLEKLDAYHIGYLLYYFEISCGISAYLLEVNPFDQPGVEAYKIKMFELLGKPSS